MTQTEQTSKPGEPAAAQPLIIERGTCHVFFAYDVGLGIDLDEAERRITQSQQRERIRHKRRAPHYFEFQPQPVRVTHAVESVNVGPFRTATSVDTVLYDFGAISVVYAIPISGPAERLLKLSSELWDHSDLQAHSLAVVRSLLAAISPAVRKPAVSALVEDYSIYQIEAFSPPGSLSGTAWQHRALLARILRSEDVDLSEEEVAEALARQLTFSPKDRAIMDWNAAILFDRDADDVRAVLEFANVELLEMRYLDDRLDDALDQAYEAMQRRPRRQYSVLGSKASDLWRIAELQMDAALLFEGVNNSLKLLGDQYLARVYRTASERLHLNDWNASILRKLETIESIYEKISDQQANWRIEVLEWIIIILIALEIVIFGFME